MFFKVILFMIISLLYLHSFLYRLSSWNLSLQTDSLIVILNRARLGSVYTNLRHQNQYPAFWLRILTRKIAPINDWGSIHRNFNIVVKPWNNFYRSIQVPESWFKLLKIVKARNWGSTARFCQKYQLELSGVSTNYLGYTRWFVWNRKLRSLNFK